VNIERPCTLVCLESVGVFRYVPLLSYTGVIHRSTSYDGELIVLVHDIESPGKIGLRLPTREWEVHFNNDVIRFRVHYANRRGDRIRFEGEAP
jgi:hypothetical protein